MTRYHRRIIMASIGLHILGLSALFVYWLFSDPFKEENIQEVTTHTPQSSSNGNDNQPSSEPEKPVKNPNQKYEEGDLSKQQLSQIIENSVNENSSLTRAEKIEKLNDKLDGISRTPVKEVEKMADLVKEAINIDKSNPEKKPIREMTNNDDFDYNSSIIYDFEKNDDMIILIFKDKNNLIVKGPPEKFDELDPDTKMHINLMQKRKENKKFQILLDTTNSILEKMHPKSEDEKSTNP